MKKIRLLFNILLLFLIISCDNSETVVVTPTPTVSIDVVTPQNVKNYMVDKNASTETVALFYNLRNLGKTKIIIGQQDAFNSFYQNSGSSDIKKNYRK